MSTQAATGAEIAPRRLTLAAIVEQLIHALARGGSDHSTIELARNARGDTQIRVSVRTGETAEIATPRQALEHAVTLYDELAEQYPPGLGAVSLDDLRDELERRTVHPKAGAKGGGDDS